MSRLKYNAASSAADEGGFEDGITASITGGGAGIISAIKNEVLSKLFKINHVLMIHNSLTEYVFLALILVEFLQIIFLVLHDMPVLNEFSNGNISHPIASSNMSSPTDLLNNATDGN